MHVQYLHAYFLLAFCFLNSLHTHAESCRLLLFFKINFSQNSLNSSRNTNRVSNGFDPDQERHFIDPQIRV